MNVDEWGVFLTCPQMTETLMHLEYVLRHFEYSLAYKFERNILCVACGQDTYLWSPIFAW